MTDAQQGTTVHPPAPTADDQHPIDDPRNGMFTDGLEEPEEEPAPGGGGTADTKGNGSAG